MAPLTLSQANFVMYAAGSSSRKPPRITVDEYLNLRETLFNPDTTDSSLFFGDRDFRQRKERGIFWFGDTLGYPLAQTGEEFALESFAPDAALYVTAFHLRRWFNSIQLFCLVV